jgi:hypothetical protein
MAFQMSRTTDCSCKLATQVKWMLHGMPRRCLHDKPWSVGLVPTSPMLVGTSGCSTMMRARTCNASTVSTWHVVQLPCGALQIPQSTGLSINLIHMCNRPYRPAATCGLPASMLACGSLPHPSLGSASQPLPTPRRNAGYTYHTFLVPDVVAFLGCEAHCLPQQVFALLQRQVEAGLAIVVEDVKCHIHDLTSSRLQGQDQGHLSNDMISR